jgi:hypothetical protein
MPPIPAKNSSALIESILMNLEKIVFGHEIVFIQVCVQIRLRAIQEETKG